MRKRAICAIRRSAGGELALEALGARVCSSERRRQHRGVGAAELGALELGEQGGDVGLEVLPSHEAEGAE